MDLLVVIDMQNDFITGSLKAKDGERLLKEVVKKVESFEGKVVYTLDTHYDDYLSTNEGKNLPIEHCIKGTWGHDIPEELKMTKSFEGAKKFEKNTFASVELGEYVKKLDEEEGVGDIYFLGLVADICVVSNILLVKGFLPEKNIYLFKDLTEGLTDEKKASALDVLESCQVKIIWEIRKIKKIKLKSTRLLCDKHKVACFFNVSDFKLFWIEKIFVARKLKVKLKLKIIIK